MVGDDTSGFQLFGPPHILECKLASMSLSSFAEERTDRQLLFGKAVFVWFCFSSMVLFPKAFLTAGFPGSKASIRVL